MILVILHKVFGRLLLVTLIPHFKIEVIAFVIFVQRLDNCCIFCILIIKSLKTI